MGLARSTFYDLPAQPSDEASIVAAIGAVCEEFVFYGYRRVGAALRQKGLIVNHKRIRRLMRQHGLQPSTSKRFAVTTNSNHEGPIFPNLAGDMILTGPNQLWASDITYIALPDRFVYVAIVQDAWSRLIVGYAIGRSVDKRLAIAALLSAIARRKPPPGLVHHSDRGVQYASLAYCDTLSRNGMIGSMGRKGNPYDNAQVESFMKTLKLEAVYPMDFSTFADVADYVPYFIEEVYNPKRLHSALGYLSPQQFEEKHTLQMGKPAAYLSTQRGAVQKKFLFFVNNQRLD
jgi:putative transposase